MKKKVIAKKRKPQPVKSANLPATHGALNEFRKELKSDVASVLYQLKGFKKDVDARFNKVDARFSEIDARFNKVEARFSEIDARFNQIDARFSEIDARFNKVEARLNEMDAKIEDIKATTHRMLALMEEQNARNKVVMDGFIALAETQQRFEERLDKVENTLIEIVRFIKTRDA